MTPEELLKKYDVPGPRYTSYPTVPYWEATPSQEEWLSHLEAAATRGRMAGQGASVYIHVPFCRSLCHFCGCNTFITRSPSVIEPYVAGIRQEWLLYTARLGRLRLDEVHVGGGTPTHLPAAQLEAMLGAIFEMAEVPNGGAFSIEVDPRVTTRAQLEALARLGFTRISLGVQDFDPLVQHTINRIQTVEEVREVTQTARTLGFTSVNFDLIYGLPKQTPNSIALTMEIVKKLKPERIAFYGYAHVPWMKSVMRRFQTSDVPTGLEKRMLYETGHRILAEAGYHEIGIDHFGLENDGLLHAARTGRLHRNFMGYTEHRTMPLLGLGVSAIGDTWTAYAQNEKTVPAWQAQLARSVLPIAKGHRLSDEDLVLRRHILNIMTRFETNWTQAQLKYMQDVPTKLEVMHRDGLVEIVNSGMRVTEAGRPFVRSICMALDARLTRQEPQGPTFSRTV